MNTPYTNASIDYPDLEVVLLSVSPGSKEGERFMKDIGLKKEVGPKSHLVQYEL